MQNPNEDTEWNDVLRAKGIIPQKPIEKEMTEDEIVQMLEGTIQEKTGGVNLEKLSLGELDELEDDEEERVLAEYKAKRLRELKSELVRSKFGTVLEISAQDYTAEVNKAGEGVWVILHLYKQGIPLCALINQHLTQLAAKFPTTKFIKSISTVCIPNYPDKNVPTIFVYFEGNMKQQFIGPIPLRGMNLTIDELEFLLGKAGAVPTSIKKDPRPKVEDKMMASLGVRNRTKDSDTEEED
ncbi:viral IAP-associated factor homolog isoform X2 [Folsomia candida]|uniref:viral IAP-associated factor homolog isoform X2 n=1 Tax=Folsomia candida TaxID=158441 RepID=UPI000B9074C7|nr:viral IAP-associated factor homolog isoform X2 [Folsomia candida]